MTKIEEFLSQWQDSREGLIKEVERVPKFQNPDRIWWPNGREKDYATNRAGP